MAHAPSPSKTLWAAFGSILCCKAGGGEVARTTTHPISQGSPAPGGSTFPVWFQTLLLWVMLLHLAEQEHIHWHGESPCAAKPNLLPKARRGEQTAQRECWASAKAWKPEVKRGMIFFPPSAFFLSPSHVNWSCLQAES